MIKSAPTESSKLYPSQNTITTLTYVSIFLNLGALSSFVRLIDILGKMPILNARHEAWLKNASPESRRFCITSETTVNAAMGEHGMRGWWSFMTWYGMWHATILSRVNAEKSDFKQYRSYDVVSRKLLRHYTDIYLHLGVRNSVGIHNSYWVCSGCGHSSPFYPSHVGKAICNQLYTQLRANVSRMALRKGLAGLDTSSATKRIQHAALSNSPLIKEGRTEQ